METKIIETIISVSGVLAVGILSYYAGKQQNKTEIIKIQNEYNLLLYSERLKAYQEIFELVSAFVKPIRRDKIKYSELEDFYNKYSLLDSKHGVLFAYTIRSSSDLMKNIKNILDDRKNHDIFIEKTDGLLRYLGDVENTMRHELGTLNLSLINNDFKLPKTTTEALDRLYLKNAENN